MGPGVEVNGDDENQEKGISYDQIENISFVHTFKIYSNTTFEDLRLASIKFWEKENQDSWILTDEYFNNLAAFKDPI